MPSSLVKFRNRVGKGESKLWWGRSDVDGLPFRGAHPPMMSEAEFEARVVRVADVRNAFFNVKDYEENKQFLDVLDCCLNGWFQLLHLERFWQGTTMHYLEWAEYFLEDGTRAPYAIHTGGMMEAVNGQQNHFGYAGTNGS